MALGVEVEMLVLVVALAAGLDQVDVCDCVLARTIDLFFMSF